MTRTQKIILLLIAVFSLTVLVVTAVNLTTKNAIPAKNLRKADPSYESILKKSKKDGTPSNIYTSLGSLRCITADAVTVIISPYFSYQKEDIAFFEELSSKNKKLQQITIQYVKTHTYN
ncbi:MAG TPA: hypothetical protein VFC68_00620, partial [Treponemataceae bacterium]|nr:hypothetical protein [Treponemataceae bacterium]